MLTCNLPLKLQHEFEQAAQSVYEHDSTQHALVEAVQLWLAEHRKQVIRKEEKRNNEAFETLRTELEQTYDGKWIMIAEGKLQGSAQSPTELNHLAPNALHRIVVQVGQHRPKEVELGWQMTFA